MSNNLTLITGCSGGGKSTLLDALSSRGYNTISEPGRRIIAAENVGSGENLPWVNMKAFARCALDMARSDYRSASRMAERVFFDRGMIDAAVALQDAGGKSYRETLGQRLHYSKTVFLAPPWPELFVEDEERRHGFKSASEEYHRLEFALGNLGYRTCILPKVSVEDRVMFVLDQLASLSR
ncbi:MAG: AAA family ATPase [Litoreibacter sp.]